MQMLEHFIESQNLMWDRVIGELKQGKKFTHWMWFVFPQIAGLGRSYMAKKYSLNDRQHAKAYIEHAVLGSRLIYTTTLLLAHEDKKLIEIFGEIDAMKFISSMTLFSQVSESPVFEQALTLFNQGRKDIKTMEKLNE